MCNPSLCACLPNSSALHLIFSNTSSLFFFHIQPSALMIIVSESQRMDVWTKTHIHVHLIQGEVLLCWSTEKHSDFCPMFIVRIDITIGCCRVLQSLAVDRRSVLAENKYLVNTHSVLPPLRLPSTDYSFFYSSLCLRKCNFISITIPSKHICSRKLVKRKSNFSETGLLGKPWKACTSPF